MKVTILLSVFILCFSCKAEVKKIGSSQKTKTTIEPIKTQLSQVDTQIQNTILSRFKAPKRYKRAKYAPNSFKTYLRTLPLKPEGAEVKYFNGSYKGNKVYDAVVDLEIGDKDLHQCADAVMRLRAEYLWAQKEYDRIHFNFTNGFRVDYSEWMKGRRIIVEGNRTFWNTRNNPSNTYEDFWKYLEQIFMFAGTASLEKELVGVNIQDATIGDVLIRGGHPGHAVIIVDECVHEETGEKLYLLAQSYMPAQEIQILKNPNDLAPSAWYRFDQEDISTPEWRFESSHLKRFRY